MGVGDATTTFSSPDGQVHRSASLTTCSSPDGKVPTSRCSARRCPAIVRRERVSEDGCHSKCAKRRNLRDRSIVPSIGGSPLYRLVLQWSAPCRPRLKCGLHRTVRRHAKRDAGALIPLPAFIVAVTSEDHAASFRITPSKTLASSVR
jgi:hypothetical protein